MFAAVRVIIMQQTLGCLQQYLWSLYNRHWDVCGSTCGHNAADIMMFAAVLAVIMQQTL